MLIEYISNYTACELNTLSAVRLIYKRPRESEYTLAFRIPDSDEAS